MKESRLNGKARDAIRKDCPKAVVWKHADRFTAGIPDSSVTWNGADSWLEFKLLGPNESIHDQLKTVQLVELVRVERQTGRAWVVAYRKGSRNGLEAPSVTFWRPTALLDGKEPIAQTYASGYDFLERLQEYGVATWEGHDHAAVALLIRLTHK